MSGIYKNLSTLKNLLLSYIYTYTYTHTHTHTYTYTYTDYRLDGSGSNPGGGRDFPPIQTDPEAYPVSCKMCTGSFPGVDCGLGLLLTTHPLLVPRSWKSRATPLPTLWATPGL